MEKVPSRAVFAVVRLAVPTVSCCRRSSVSKAASRGCRAVSTPTVLEGTTSWNIVRRLGGSLTSLQRDEEDHSDRGIPATVEPEPAGSTTSEHGASSGDRSAFVCWQRRSALRLQLGTSLRIAGWIASSAEVATGGRAIDACASRIVSECITGRRLAEFIWQNRLSQIRPALARDFDHTRNRLSLRRLTLSLHVSPDGMLALQPIESRRPSD